MSKTEALYHQLADGLLPSLIEAGMTPDEVIKEFMCAVGFFASQHDKEKVYLHHAGVAKKMFETFKAQK